MEREQARQLRSAGMSVKDIAKQLGIAKSSVSLWVRDIELSAEQKLVLKNKHPNYDAAVKGSNTNHHKALQQRIAYQQEGRAKARESDPLHLAGCMLYWAEGAKTRNSVQLVNSDPDMMRVFIRFLRQSLHVPDEQMNIRAICYTNNGVSVEEIETYWLNLLELPAHCLRRTTVNVQPASSRQRGRKLIYGVCVLSVYRVRIAQRIFGAIQEYIGIDKPEWVL